MRRLSPIEQPDEITCGPSCLKMVGDLHGCAAGIGVQSLGDLCGTNPFAGTTDAGMRRGLDGMGLGYAEHAPGGVDGLREGLARGSTFLLRTLTMDVKHWVAAAGVLPDGSFRILDPWLGERALDDRQIDAICAPRGWQVFEVPARQDPRGFLRMTSLERCWDQAVALAEDTFAAVFPRDLVAGELEVADRSLSRALWVGDRFAGAYFLSRTPLRDDIANGRMDGLSAICGEGLAVAPEFKGRGYGSMLRALPSRMGADYVWGTQLKSLRNLKDWLKRREVVGESQNCWVTLEAVTQPARAALEDIVWPRPAPEPPAAPAPARAP